MSSVQLFSFVYSDFNKGKFFYLRDNLKSIYLRTDEQNLVSSLSDQIYNYIIFPDYKV